MTEFRVSEGELANVIGKSIRNDPKITPGQARYPQINMPAKAIPEGGQMAVAWPEVTDRRIPSFPVMQ